MTSYPSALVLLFGGLIMQQLTGEPWWKVVAAVGVALIALGVLLDIANWSLDRYKRRLQRQIEAARKASARRATPPSSL